MCLRRGIGATVFLVASSVSGAAFADPDADIVACQGRMPHDACTTSTGAAGSCTEELALDPEAGFVPVLVCIAHASDAGSVFVPDASHTDAGSVFVPDASHTDVVVTDARSEAGAVPAASSGGCAVRPVSKGQGRGATMCGALAVGVVLARRRNRRTEEGAPDQVT